MKSPHVAILALFSLTVLASLIAVACTSPRESDSGTTEAPFSGTNGYGGYGYSGVGDVADDSAGL